jgi:hypothetical protein
MRVCCCCTALIVATVFAGCSSSDNTANRLAELDKTNIQKVANLYNAFIYQHGGFGPKVAAELKEFVIKGGIAENNLRLMLIDPKNLDSIFISERDGQPFKIRPMVQGNPLKVSAVVFEEKGVDGRRQVGFTDSTVQEVDDAKYKELWKGASSETKSTGSEDGKTGG